MQGRKSYPFILIAAIAVALLSLIPDNALSGGWSWSQDWMWFIVAMVGIAVTVYSDGFQETRIPRSLTIYAVIPLIMQIILTTARIFGSTDTIWILSLVMQTWAATAFGYMLALAIDRKTDISISNRWRLLFALMFACSFGGFYIFFMFINLWVSGYPVFNHDLLEYSVRIEMNKRIMYPSVVATFGTVVATFVLRHMTKEPSEGRL